MQLQLSYQRGLHDSLGTLHDALLIEKTICDNVVLIDEKMHRKLLQCFLLCIGTYL